MVRASEGPEGSRTRSSGLSASSAGNYEHVPYNPEGTVGVAVGDGAYNAESSSADIRNSALEYLSRAGLNVAPMPLKGLGGSGEIILALATGVATDVLIHLWKQAREFFRSWRETKTERARNAHRVRCTVQLGDKRGSERDAIQLLLLLPELKDHLAAAYPNRDYWFVIFSATPNIDFVQVELTEYDHLSRTVRQMEKAIRKVPRSGYMRLLLQDGPFGSRRVTYHVV